jgi:hypothetical protein
MDMPSRRLLGVVLTALMVFATFGVAAADSGAESQFVSLINQSRKAAGLQPLEVHSDLVSYARRHTDRMIAEGKIFHSTSSQLSSATSGWSLLGENVGMGPDPVVLHDAFMNSPSHRENILGPFDAVGVGAARDENGTLFVTVIFKQSTAPAPTTTTTTTAPTTTTTVPTAVLGESTTPKPAPAAETKPPAKESAPKARPAAAPTAEPVGAPEVKPADPQYRLVELEPGPGYLVTRPGGPPLRID